MERHVEPELLDELPAVDPSAAGSRDDINRLNGWMGSATTMARALRSVAPGRGRRRLVDLGASDGRFLLRVAHRLAGDWAGTEAVLVDHQDVVRLETRDAFERLGWRIAVVKSDVFDWLRGPVVQPLDAVVANLFLHHFSAARVKKLLAAVAERTGTFVAVEPCRSAWAYAASRLVWAIGCNAVTRHDAPVSVQAGFAGDELSRLWPADGTWHLAERRAGSFGHLFAARKRQANSVG